VAKVTVYLREGCPWCERLVEALERYSYLFTDVQIEVVFQPISDFGPLLRHVAEKTYRPSYPLEEAFYKAALERGVPPLKALEASLKGASTPQLVIEAKSPSGEAMRVVVVGSAATPEVADALVLNLRRLLNALKL